jgi:uncharacterized protein (DUF433 family)
MSPVTDYEIAEDDPRAAWPIFTVFEASRYLRVPNSTLRTWIRPEHGDPLVSSVTGKPYLPRLTFLGFAEAFVIASARRAGVHPHRIREGVDRVRDEIGVEYALATRRLYHDKTELLIAEEGGTDIEDPADLEVARNRQIQMTKMVKTDLKNISYGDDGIAASLQLPAFEIATVIVDPLEAFGAPIVSRTGTRIRDIISLAHAGEDLRDIAYDFDLSVEEVRDVISAQEKPSAS